eukprot:scaffold1242_cov123-Cylindrotheca_fusiformis.AAC.9
MVFAFFSLCILLLSTHLQEARLAFMFADCVLLGAVHFIDRGLKAEKKAVEDDALQEAQQQHELEKAASRAQQEVIRQQQKAKKKSAGPIGNGKKNFSIQQPKRD